MFFVVYIIYNSYICWGDIGGQGFVINNKLKTKLISFGNPTS